LIQRISVVNRCPSEFILSEKIERFFELIFFASYSLWVALTLVFGFSANLGIKSGTVTYVLVQSFSILSILIGTGLLLEIEMNVVENSKLLKQIKEVRIPKKWWRLLEFYPSETIRAKTRFVVLTEFLSARHSRKSILRKFGLFREGIKIYNTHLKDDFGFVLSEPKRFVNKAIFVSHSQNGEDIRFGLEVLIDAMTDDKEEPLEIIKLLKQMLNEPTSSIDVCADIDTEPNRIRRVASRHSQSILGLGGFIVGVVALIIQYLR
jgi:hypothetical protein